MTPHVSPTTLAGFPAIETAGSANRPPLLFLHGAFAGHLPFAGWMSVLAGQGWRGVAVGRRGARTGDVAKLRIADLSTTPARQSPRSARRR
jgi:hypothetical protein